MAAMAADVGAEGCRDATKDLPWAFWLEKQVGRRSVASSILGLHRTACLLCSWKKKCYILGPSVIGFL